MPLYIAPRASALHGVDGNSLVLRPAAAAPITSLVQAPRSPHLARLSTLDLLGLRAAARPIAAAGLRPAAADPLRVHANAAI